MILIKSVYREHRDLLIEFMERKVRHREDT